MPNDRLSKGSRANAVVVLLLTMLAGGAHGQTSEWLQLRGDRHMSGRASGVGQMHHEPPQERWRYDIAAWEGYVEVAQREGSGAVELPFAAPVDPGYIGTHGRDWGIGPQIFDLGGVEVAMPVDNVFKVAQILPGEASLQRFEMGNSFSDGGVEPKQGRLLAYDSGEPRVVWETEFFTNTWDPNVLVVDVDVDGQLDIVVATHYRILVFDGATGETKMQLQYHGYRNYGWFGAANIDDDPYPEFGVVADFSMHSEVIDNDGTALSLRWLRDIQPDPSQSTKVVRPKPQALVDVDGDGSFELVYSIYNDQGDGQWHIVGVDALSGETRFDFPQHHLHGMADVDGDGSLELFVSATSGEALPTYAPLAVWSLKAGAATVRWSHERGRFSTVLLNQLPLTVSTGAADGLRTVSTGDVDGDGRRDFFALAPDGAGEVLVALGSDSAGRIGPRWSVRGPAGMALETAAVTDDGVAALLYLKGSGLPSQVLMLEGASGVLHQWSRQEFTPAGTPVVADLEGDGRVEVVVQTATRGVLCLQAPGEGGGEPRLRWQVPGYGQTNNAPYHWGLVAADVDGDGRREVLAAREAASGNASLVALAADGTIRWQTEFVGFDGSMPIWNFSGLSYWSVGYFRSEENMDVFASLRRGKLGSEVGFLIDGRSGEIVWESKGFILPENGSGRSLGGHPSAAGDVDGDGLEEIVIMWPDRLHIVDGVTGTAQVVRQAYGDGLNPLFESDSFVGYAFPAVVDLFGDSRPELLWGHCGYLNAVLDGDGQRIWQTPYRNNTEVQSLMGVGDSDGDGTVELLASTADGVRLFQAADGAVLLEFDDGVRAHTDVVSGDVDGDGRDEFLFGSGTKLICVEQEEGTLRRAWTLEVEGRSSDVALADVDGDGLLDVVVTTTDGYVKAYMGEAAATAVQAVESTPQKTHLQPPYPNPFNSRVHIDFSVGPAGKVRLEVFGPTGQRVKTLVAAWRKPGTYRVRWDAEGLASGVYLVRLQTGDIVQERKVSLVK